MVRLHFFRKRLLIWADRHHRRIQIFRPYIVTRCISQPPPNIISYTNVEKFRYDDDLAISAIDLLSYVVGVDVLLSVHYSIFWLRWATIHIPRDLDSSVSRVWTLLNWEKTTCHRKKNFNKKNKKKLKR